MSRCAPAQAALATAYESLGLYAQGESHGKSPDRERASRRMDIAGPGLVASGDDVAQWLRLSHQFFKVDPAQCSREGTFRLTDRRNHHLVEQCGTDGSGRIAGILNG